MKKRSIIIAIAASLIIILIGCVSLFSYYKVNLSAVDVNNKEEIEFIIDSGSTTSSIIKTLYSKGLIRNEIVLKIYAKLNPGVPKSGRYILNKSMDAASIYKTIIDGKVKNETIWITFVEGKRLDYIAKQIADKTEYTEEEINTLLDDKTYIKELIDKYDILTDEILKNGIYRPLEGYLFPDTYEFLKTASAKDIIEKMISTMSMKLSKYKNEIEASKYSIHELITLASVIELEGAGSDDRQGIAGVFYNRLKSGWTLGSDVTTYYGVKKDFSKELTRSDLNSCNGYNTRGTCVRGLPIGPIASVGIESLEAAIKPTQHDYYYFVADKNRKTYFSKTESEHNRIIRELYANGLWYTF